MANLKLFTNSFPFGKKETYLEAEIIYLSQYYDTIEIFPAHYKERDTSCRKVPLNVLVHNPAIELNRYTRFKKFVTALSLCLIPKGYFYEPFDFNLFNKPTQFIKWLFSLIDSANYILYSKKHKVFDEPDSIYYFYWLRDFAYVFPILSDSTLYRTFVRVHGGEIFLERAGGYIPLLKYMVNDKVKYLAISQLVKSTLLQNHNLLESQIYISRLINSSNGSNPSPEVNSPVRIVSVANLIPLKRINLLIDALSEIKDEKIEWFHFGDGPLKSDLERYAKNKVGQNVTIIWKGQIPNTELMKFYSEKSVDAFVNTSQYEGLPYSIIEAMSFSIPIIATNVGATSECVSSSNGILLDSNFKVESLSQSIKSLRSEIWYYKRKKSRIIWEKMFSSFEKNYKILINEN